MSKTAKFFIACAVAFCLGTGMFFAGYAAHGVEGMDRVAERYDWIVDNPGEMQHEILSEEEFDSIDIKGEADIVLVGTMYEDDMKNCVAKEIYEAIRLNGTGSGTVYVGYSQYRSRPEAGISKGILNINCEESMNQSGVNLNFNEWDGFPVIVIFCGDRELKSIDIESEDGDVELLGVKYENAGISTFSGDVFMECAGSSGLNVKTDNGDCNIHGDFRGITDLSTDSGEINLETALNEKSYSREITVTNGDLTLNDYDVEVEENSIVYVRDGGPNKLKVNSHNGDVQIWYGDAKF